MAEPINAPRTQKKYLHYSGSTLITMDRQGKCTGSSAEAIPWSERRLTKTQQHNITTVSQSSSDYVLSDKTFVPAQVRVLPLQVFARSFNDNLYYQDKNANRLLWHLIVKQ